MVFDAAAGISSSSSLIGYSASSLGWLEGKRQKANSEFTYNGTVASQADFALPTPLASISTLKWRCFSILNIPIRHQAGC